ncbi:MAG: IS66 family insertion sequence element accessory protein TnpA [Acetatifactor sp.]
MNSKQKLHQIKLTQWASRFQEQAASGLTVKARCVKNNVTIHTYNYWKHPFIGCDLICRREKLFCKYSIGIAFIKWPGNI